MADINNLNSSCVICRRNFCSYLIYYSCTDGHLFCKKCYKGENCKARRSSCLYKFCKSAIFQIDNRSGKPYVKTLQNSLKMFPEPTQISKTSLKETTMMKRNKSFVSEGSRGNSNCSVNSLSKKPVNCPYGGCEKSIATTAVGYHFKFEHNSVAFINSRFETRHSLRLHPCAISYKKNLCVLLIETHEKNKISGEIIAKPIMIVLGARIPNNEDVGDSEDSNEEFGLHPPNYFDKILLWVACSIPRRHKYTIGVSTRCQSIRLKYYGTVAQIGDDPQTVLGRGKGLILNSSHVIGMTNCDTQPVNLDVIIHNEELFESDWPFLSFNLR